MNDLRYSLRALRQSPGFTAVAVLTLALGIGANASIFTVVNRLLFDPVPFLDGERLVAVWETAPRGQNDRNEFSAATFRDLRAEAGAVDRLVAHSWFTANLTGGDRPERLQGFAVTADYFDTLGLPTALGRTFAAEEDEAGKDAVVILSHELWQRRFGGDPTILGTAISLNGIQRTVIGVLPAGARYPAAGQLWVPLVLDPEGWMNRRSHFLLVTGRIADGATLEEARAELGELAAGYGEQYPETNTGWGINVQPLVRDLGRTMQPALLMLFGAVGFVLLIACANVANLLLARGAGRQRELAIRAAVGAGRWRLARQLLAESLVLAVLGGVAGGLLAVWGVDLLKALVRPEHRDFIAGFAWIQLDRTAAGFTAALSLLTVLLFGLAPALGWTRADRLDGLKEGGRTSTGARRHRLRSGLIGAEVALALLLVVGAGLMYRSFRHLGDTPLGFDVEGIAVSSLGLPDARYPDPDAAASFYRSLTERLEQLPLIQAAGAANVVPLCSCNQTTSFAIEDEPPFAPGEEPDVGYRVVTPGYFAALGIALRQGRVFRAADDADSPRVAIVNETLARRYFGDDDPLGRRLLHGSSGTPLEIVGVVADVRHAGPAEPADPELYQPAAQLPARSMSLVVRAAAGDPAALLPAIRAEVERLDAEQPVYDQRTMRASFDLAVGAFTFSLRLLGGLGVIALALAAIGIYGVVGTSVAERTRDIAVRMALGGDRADVLRLVVRQGMRPVAIGLAAGLIAAFGATRVLAGVLVGVGTADPLAYGFGAIVLAGVALASTYLPARRAARLDPMTTLRAE